MRNKIMKNMLASGMVLASFSMVSTATLASPYDKYKGTNLVVNFPAIIHFNNAKSVIAKFEEETGIGVEVDSLQYLKMREKQKLELKRKSGDYDLIAYVVMDKGPYGLSGNLEPLGKYFGNPNLADPNYDAEDLIPAYVNNIGIVGGNKGYLPGPTGMLVGVPFGSETSVLGYRKDLFEKHNVSVPTSYEEMLSAGCTIAEKEDGVYGLASRGASGHQITHAWLLHLAPLGGRVFDDNWNVTLNNEAGVQALDTLKKIAECGHPSMASFGAGDSNTAFLQGEMAMFLDSTNVAGDVDNPDKSKVVGKVGWALHPEGVRRGSQSGGFGIGIPSNAKNKEAAFLLLQWLTSKRIDKEIVLAGGGASRISTMKDPEVNAARPYMSTFADALAYSDPDWRPLIPAWDEINAPVLGVALSEALIGKKTSQEALDGIVPEIEAIMQRKGYGTWN